jgi:type II secretory pathway pseudopilin PulG
MNILPSIIQRRKNESAFTLIEIALCLAIIGFAILAVMIVLPYGLGAQRDNREETVIGQDATVLLELIRSGSDGADDLTNYVYAITNSWGLYDGAGNRISSGVNSYTFLDANEFGAAVPYRALTNGANIIGLLSTPQYYTNNYNAPGVHPLPNAEQGGLSNHVVAYVRSFSGLAAEKPPQDNAIMREDSFSYRVFCVNAFLAQDSNTVNQVFNRNIGGALHEIRLKFLWPILPNGNVGGGSQNFRVSVAGDLKPDAKNGLFYYQPQTFSTAP